MPPAGSPELNPAAQVWQQSRDRHLANRCDANDEQTFDACCAAWNLLTQIPGAIRSSARVAGLASRPHPRRHILGRYQANAEVF